MPENLALLHLHLPTYSLNTTATRESGPTKKVITQQPYLPRLRRPARDGKMELDTIRRELLQQTYQHTPLDAGYSITTRII